MEVDKTEVSRRMVIGAAAWSVPVLVLAVASPATAASLGTLQVDLVTTQLGAAGYALNLRDGKTRNGSAANTDRTDTTVVTVVFKVVDASTGMPVPGATCVVDGGSQRDAEGNYVLGIVATRILEAIGESPTKRIDTEVSNASGLILVKIATATWGGTDCAPGAKGLFVPKPGTLTVFASAPGYSPATTPFPYLVYDGAPLAGGVNGCG